MIGTSQKNELFSTTNKAFHQHNGIDAPRIKYSDLLNAPTGLSTINGRSHNSTTQSIPINSGGTPVLLALDTSDFANGITWDSTTHLFTCITAGIYMVTCTIALNTSSIQSGDSYTASIYKNASAVVAWTWATGIQGLVLGCTDLVSLAIGDTVSFYVTLGGNGAMTINAASGAIALV